MLKKIGIYLREICCVFIGFYLMAIVLSFATDTNQNLMSVLNGLGVFLSSVGVIVAILTVLQQYYLHKSKEENNAINASNVFLFKLTYMLEVYGRIKNNYNEQHNSFASEIELLDGTASDWVIDIDFEKIIFISEINSKIYTESYYVVFNYNRYIKDIFRWQQNQSLHSLEENHYYLVERINKLQEFGTELIELQNEMHKTLKSNYPEHSFFIPNVSCDEFRDLIKITT